MRRNVPALLLALATVGPILSALTGCSDLIAKLKGEAADDADSGAATAVVAPTPDAEAPTVDTAATPATTPAAPLTAAPTVTQPTPTTTTTVRPPAVVDAGPAPVDAGAPTVVDAGPAPAPTPTLNLPQILLDAGLRGFDAGGLKLPTFPK